jgi:enamine deaminase RidA (YjgF/YER057c/UK114 family)
LKIEEKIGQLGIKLPESAKPAAMYIPAKQLGKALHVSGQIPFVNGQLAYTGKVGKERTLQEAEEAARVCTLNIIAAVRDHIAGC